MMRFGTHSDLKVPEGAAQDDYKAFIDGLRAVSILAVVGFHLGVPGFSGGFVGVDVFFVISGFLIVNQIKDNLEKGRFSIWSFYSRRALRILPPYLAVVLAIVIAAPFVLPTPTVYLEYALQAALAPLMLSNFLFYQRQGYFDLAAYEKPLLHTWTLSIEEQFYLLAPVLLLGIFFLDKRRFGRLAFTIAAVFGLVSLAGAVAFTVSDGRNPAFYFPHWRAWEFIAGGMIGGWLVDLVRRTPRLVTDVMGLAGFVCILAAITLLDAQSPFPSWRAIMPVVGAVLIILAGISQPQNLVAKLLAMRWMVVVGLVFYGWYLWHWPILSFQRTLRLGEPSLIPDLIGGGLLAFVLACISYRYLELPIRGWRRSRGTLIPPGRIVAAGVAACLAVAVIGGASAYVGYLANSSALASRYGTNGKGVLENGCRVFVSHHIADHCLEGRFGLLIGDSHADALSRTFARAFDQKGWRLVSMARGGCDPLMFAPSRRQQNRDHHCSNLLGPFERAIAQPEQVSFVVITSLWATKLSPETLSELIRQFDAARTRILVIGPVPIFKTSSLDCVVLSDRVGRDREACSRSRAELESLRMTVASPLKEMVAQFSNVRYIDPMAAFCDDRMCRPFDGNRVYFRDGGHVLPSGADRILETFAHDFSWLAENRL